MVKFRETCKRHPPADRIDRVRLRQNAIAEEPSDQVRGFFVWRIWWVSGGWPTGVSCVSLTEKANEDKTPMQTGQTRSGHPRGYRGRVVRAAANPEKIVCLARRLAGTMGP